jgi:hypothetical protein
VKPEHGDIVTFTTRDGNALKAVFYGVTSDADNDDVLAVIKVQGDQFLRLVHPSRIGINAADWHLFVACVVGSTEEA